MIQFKKTDLHYLKLFRDNYFLEIKLSQELMLEWLIAEAYSYLIINDEKEIGYFIVSNENTLLEFHLIFEVLPFKEEVFKLILEKYSISDIYCKSFDHVLLACCHTFCKSSEAFGTIFRDFIRLIYNELESDITIRLAEKSDIPMLLEHDGSELYESPEELDYTVRNRSVYLFEKENILIGCGYLIRILPDKSYFDLGMWTNPPFRNLGYATMIISYLKNYCLEHAYIPVCGCAADNLASRKTLEKCGFISKYSIIRFYCNRL